MIKWISCRWVCKLTCVVRGKYLSLHLICVVFLMGSWVTCSWDYDSQIYFCISREEEEERNSLVFISSVSVFQVGTVLLAFVLQPSSYPDLCFCHSQTWCSYQVSVLPSGGQGAFCGRLCSGMQEGPERHPAPGYGSAASRGQARGHSSAGAARHRGKRGLVSCGLPAVFNWIIGFHNSILALLHTTLNFDES